MSGICIITFTILTHIIPGSAAYQVGLLSSSENSSEPAASTQYTDDHHHLRRLPPSHPSYNETPPYTTYIFNAALRDVEVLLNNLDFGLLDSTKRGKSKRSTQYPRSSEDYRMLKQLYDDAVNTQGNSQQGAESRNFLYPSFDAWANSFTSFFWRDMAFNVFKIVGLSALYYLAPGVLDWYTMAFGNT